MPVSGVVLTCLPERLEAVRSAVERRPKAEVRDRLGNMLVVVTDTLSLEEDRAEVESLASLDGVVASHVVYSNIEDALEIAQ